NSMDESTLIWASPPGRRPTTTSDRRTRRIATPPRAMITPVNTKKITASNGNELMPNSMRWTIVPLSMTKMLIAASAEAMPMANAIGMPITSRKTNTPNRMAMVIGRCAASGGRVAGVVLEAALADEPGVQLVAQAVQHDQGARDRQRGVVPGVGERDRLHEVAAERLHEADAVDQHDVAEGEDRGVDQELHRRAQPPGKALVQVVEGDVVLEVDAHRGAEERDPDQQVARHLLRPGHDVVEAVAGDHRGDDDHEDRRGHEQDHDAQESAAEIDATIEGAHGREPLFSWIGDRQGNGPARRSN